MSLLFDPINPNIIIFDRLDSTSNEANRIIDSGYGEHGLTIWAKRQEAGHGRYGRKWLAEEGNLTFSVLIKNDQTVKNLAIYPFLTALAIRDAIMEFNDLAAIKFKWPNDILLNGKKIAGILYESRISGSKVNFLICGIGLNISSFPSGIAQVTSLAAENIQNIEAGQIIFKILQHMDKYLKLSAEPSQEQQIYEEWLKYAYRLGEELTVISASKQIKGQFETIENGNLILRSEEKRHIIATGDVFFAEDSRIITTMSNVELGNVTFLNINKNKKN